MEGWIGGSATNVPSIVIDRGGKTITKKPGNNRRALNLKDFTMLSPLNSRANVGELRVYLIRGENVAGQEVI